MRRRTLFFSALALSTGLTFASVPALSAVLPSSIEGQKLPTLASMLENVLPAVVSVYVEGTQEQNPNVPEEFKFFFGPSFPNSRPSKRTFEGLGSGVVIDAAKGYVLTNNHVISDADKIKVQLSDGREFDAKLIGRDDQTDIALLQLINASRLTAIKLADSDKLRVGDFVVAVGNPFGLGQTVTAGIVSALGRSGLNVEGIENFIQTDASINRGNSGGALVNLNGELVGINTAILAPNGGNIGIGFAIPSNMVNSLSLQLTKFGEVKRAQLGIKGTELTSDLAKTFNTATTTSRGVFVSEVLQKSAAEKAGIKAGDILISMGGKQITSFAEFRAKVGTSLPGAVIKIGLLRDGKQQNVSVTLGGGEHASSTTVPAILQGAKLSDISASLGGKGIKVHEVQKDSTAEQVGLQKNDVIIGVNRQPVENISGLRKILEAKPDVIALKVLRSGELIYLLIR